MIESLARRLARDSPAVFGARFCASCFVITRKFPPGAERCEVGERASGGMRALHGSPRAAADDEIPMHAAALFRRER